MSKLLGRLKVKTTRKVIFVDIDGYREVDFEPSGSTVDRALSRTKSHIILSPEFYFIKKEKLAVSTARKAKKFAVAVFEDILPDGSYEYKVFKCNEHFCFIAYDINKIKEALYRFHNIRLDIEKSKIHFAQSELASAHSSISIGGEYVLSNVDGIVVKLPQVYAQDTQLSLTDALRTYKPTNNYISLGAMPDFKNIYKQVSIKSAVFAVIFTIATVAFCADVYKKYKTFVEIKEQKELLIAELNIPVDRAEFDAKKKEFEDVQKRQLELRKQLKVVNSIPLVGGETIEHVLLDKGSIAITIKSSRAPEMKRYFEANSKLLGFISNGDKIECRIKAHD